MTNLEKILSEEDLKYIDAIEDQFVDYVWSFYGNEEPLYPIVGLTKKDIVDAFNIYVERIEKGDLEYVHYSWGDGDSLDRERVRDIILENPKFTLSGV